VEYLRKSRCLLIFDNFETLLQHGQRSGNYRNGYEAYGDLLWRLGETQHRSCLVITSREKPTEIAALEGDDLPVRTLTLNGLTTEAGRYLLTLKGLSGTEQETSQLVNYYRGNPLALKVAATSIRDLYDGNIAQFFAQGTAVFNGIGHLLNSQFQRLSPLEQQVMYWLAIHRETTTLAELQDDLGLAIGKSRLAEVVESLRWRSLVESTAVGVLLQPVVMEYVTDCLVERVGQEILTESPQLLLSHALIKAQAKDYIRDSQSRLIVQPILQHLQATLGSVQAVQQRLHRLIAHLQAQPDRVGYGGGNAINLLGQLGVDLTGCDCSHLTIRQADLRSLNLHRVNFAQSHFRDCALAATFGGLTCITFSPDGQRFATSDTNGEVYLWNTEDNKQLMSFKGHNSWVWSIAFSPVHPILASAGQDHTIKLWDLETGECLRTLQGHTSIVTAIAYAPATASRRSPAQLLASSSTDQTVKLWDAATGRCLQTLTGHQACVWAVAFHPDGRTLATAGEDNRIQLWDLETATCLQTLTGHLHWVKTIAFSPDGRQLVSGGFDQTVKLWDLATGVCLMTLVDHASVVTSVAFSPTGDQFASSSYDQTVRVWHRQSGACLHKLEKHSNRVWSIAFYPQGRLLASGGDDHAAMLWDLHTGQCIKNLQGHCNTIYAIASSGPQQLLASGHEDQTVKLWHLPGSHSEPGPGDLQPFRILQGHRDRVFSVVFSPDDQWLASASADRTIKLWNPHTGQCLRTLHGHHSWVWSIAVHPDGQRLASASYDHTIKLWDVQTGDCLQTWQGHNSSVLAIAFAPDGRTAVSGGYGQLIKRWDVETGQCLGTWQAHGNRVWAVAISADGRVATAGDDQTIKLWDLRTGQCLQTLQGHSSQVLRLLFTAAGQLVSSAADRTIKLWDLEQGSCLMTLAEHENWIWSLVLSSDDRLLYSSSQDETIKAWNLRTGQCQQTLRVSRPYEGMVISGATGLTPAEVSTLKALGAINSQGASGNF
jgi:WD40 repeat protein